MSNEKFLPLFNRKLNYYKSKPESNLTKQLLKNAFDLP